MSKEDLIELQGVVTEVLAGGNYKVKCGENHEVLARLNGKMRQYRIRVIAGDRVTVGVSPYDLKRGLITYRAKYPAPLGAIVRGETPDGRAAHDPSRSHTRRRVP